MSLPNPSMSFSPFAILTAEEMNDIVENIEALADGSGLDDEAVTVQKIDMATVLPALTLQKGTTTVSGDVLTIDTTARIIYTNSNAYPTYVTVVITGANSLSSGTSITIRYNATSGNAIGGVTSDASSGVKFVAAVWVSPGDSLYWQASAGSDTSAGTVITEFWFG